MAHLKDPVPSAVALRAELPAGVDIGAGPGMAKEPRSSLPDLRRLRRPTCERRSADGRSPHRPIARSRRVPVAVGPLAGRSRPRPRARSPWPAWSCASGLGGVGFARHVAIGVARRWPGFVVGGHRRRRARRRAPSRMRTRRRSWRCCPRPGHGLPRAGRTADRRLAHRRRAAALARPPASTARATGVWRGCRLGRSLVPRRRGPGRCRGLVVLTTFAGEDRRPR